MLSLFPHFSLKILYEYPIKFLYPSCIKRVVLLLFDLYKIAYPRKTVLSIFSIALAPHSLVFIFGSLSRTASSSLLESPFCSVYIIMRIDFLNCFLFSFFCCHTICVNFDMYNFSFFSIVPPHGHGRTQSFIFSMLASISWINSYTGNEHGPKPRTPKLRSKHIYIERHPNWMNFFFAVYLLILRWSQWTLYCDLTVITLS